jgi:hypothetical protein
MSSVLTLTEIAAHLLNHEEREAVLGDLSEADEGAWRGFLDVLGLVARRQLLLWKSWRPWVSGFGLALPSSFLLMGTSVGVSLAYQDLYALKSLNQPSLFVLQVLLLVAWSWSGGFVMGKLSRQTLWASVLLCFAPCLFCFARFRIPSLPRASLLLFLLPAVLGVVQGLRRTQIRLKPAFGLAFCVTALMVLMWIGGRLWFVNWSLIWPVWYIVSTARPAGGEAGRC